ncbi:rhodanese family protein [Variovorax sp. M-6]|uniref:rhodanese family protein n=1 Tax=Variovorax sp. M-6 TaxID=3233041 RepID=UPI003F96F2E3
MAVESLTPEGARERIAQGAVLVDIRAADEFAREHIAQAHHIPMAQLAARQLPAGETGAVIFYCRSGNRTRINAVALGACAPGDAYVLEGGLDGWKKAGLPVVSDASQPLELARQVQIAAGSLIVAGAVLGATVSPWFHLLSGFVGAGLVFAGVSGFCGMARVLLKMPWNRNPLAG